jgi:hypothetical protein
VRPKYPDHHNPGKRHCQQNTQVSHQISLPPAVPLVAIVEFDQEEHASTNASQHPKCARAFERLCEVKGRRDSALAAAPSCTRRTIPACRPAIFASGKAGEFA